VKPTQPTWRLGSIAIAGLCAALISGCNTEFGVDPGDGGENPGKTYPTLDGKRPQSFAQASVGSQPANSLESMGQALTQSADFISVDLVMSKDGILVALGSPNIIDITDIDSHSEFADRKTTKLIDGVSAIGWFASDFTLAELQTLRLKTPTGSTGTPPNINSFRIQSLAQVFDWAKRQARTPGLYLHTRNPTYHSKLGLPMEDKLVAALQQAGNTLATSPVMIRSTEVQHLKTLRDKTKVRLVQMIAKASQTALGDIQLAPPNDRPYDFTVAGTSTTFKDMVTTAGLAQIKTYADGISPWKPYVISSKNLDKDGNGQPDDLNKDGKLDDRDREMMTASDLVKTAHAANLFVHPFVFSNDVSTLASDFAGDSSKEYKLFYNLGVDGVFSANPSDANKAR